MTRLGALLRRLADVADEFADLQEQAEPVITPDLAETLTREVEREYQETEPAPTPTCTCGVNESAPAALHAIGCPIRP